MPPEFTTTKIPQTTVDVLTAPLSTVLTSTAPVSTAPASTVPVTTLPTPTTVRRLSTPPIPTQVNAHTWDLSDEDIINLYHSRIQSRNQPETTNIRTAHHAVPEFSTRTTIPDPNQELLRRIADLERQINKDSHPTDFLTEGPLDYALYQTILPPNSEIPNIGNFGMSQSKFADPKTFLVAFKERFRLAGYSDAVMCRVFPTCLEGKALEWYTSLPQQSITTFNQLAASFLNRFGGIRKVDKTCDSLLLIKQEPAESTRKFIDRFLEETKEVVDYDDRIALLAVKKGLKQGKLRFEAHSRNFSNLQQFINFSTDHLRGEEDCLL